MSYELHPLCTLFPRLSGAEFNLLRDDIKANGLRSPIVLHAGMILDGGNRYRACIDAGVQPSFVEFEGGNLVSFVLSVNMHRRHLSQGQQAAIVASAQDWATAQPRGGDRKSEEIKVQDCTLITSEQRAAVSGASIRTQKDADKVAKASPELAKQVAHGEKTLPQAVEELTGKRPGTKPPKLEIVSDELADLRAENEKLKAWGNENAQTAKELLEENNSMVAVFDQDERLSASVAECKKLREMNRVLEERIRGLMNEKNEAIRAAKSWQRKAEQLMKAA